MRYSQLRSAMLAQFAADGGAAAAYFVMGKPGGGKSALARDVARTHLMRLGVDPVVNENIIEFNASLRDPVDILGTPNNAEGVTDWIPPREFHNISKAVQGDKPCFLILEELSDATMAMQNPLCRVIYDRFAGQLELAPNLYIIATGNRTEDKSGANRVSTKLGNRVRMHTFDENLNDWIDWAANHGIQSTICAFLRYRPNLLQDFKADRLSNPTPRSWADVHRIPANQTSDIYMAEVAACVGEGAAAEFVAFKKLEDALVSFAEIVKNPQKVEISDKVDVRFALVGACCGNVNAKNLAQVAQFIERMPVDFQTMFWVDTVKRHRDLNTAPETKAWVQANAKKLVTR